LSRVGSPNGGVAKSPGNQAAQVQLLERSAYRGVSPAGEEALKSESKKKKKKAQSGPDGFTDPPRPARRSLEGGGWEMTMRVLSNTTKGGGGWE